MVQPLKFGNGYVILSHILLSMWLLIHAGIKVKPRLVRGATGSVLESKQYYTYYWWFWLVKCDSGILSVKFPPIEINELYIDVSPVWLHPVIE